ncbi:accessory Sec system protein Asp2 [Pseudarthrobacter sp. J47]|uniref:accessory Sec system protein Asp2 n=1 Tax=Pseudarthrobacter sp. J47 TaxID=3116482 RepID=UPI002E80A25B|nr:accessory Sec system protein Asp2 [Pseudarthrobacter sp. J47]MEE2524054.1 accessory Sec system protein Asp2 [Pseudarthrobacter sp. J47]
MNSGHDFTLMREAVLKLLPLRGGKAGRQRALRFINDEVFATPAHGSIQYGGGEVWMEISQRTRARYFHGFLFFSDWHSTIQAGDKFTAQLASRSIDIVREWTSRFGFDSPIPAISHHDETTAQRLIQLTCLLEVLRPHINDEDLGFLLAVSAETAELLATADFHAGNNNHGMFQDVALLYYSVIVEQSPLELRNEWFKTATARLFDYFSSAFTSEGVHIENTPTYHLMVARQLHGILTILAPSGHEHVPHYRALLNRAAEYATHAMKPDGMYPPISDTTEKQEIQAARLNIFQGEEFAYAASAGKMGIVPTRRTLVLPESGYAIYRSSWTDPDATFAFFSAAYNADYHKHSDELSLFVRSGGVDLLSEAGAYGYDYKEPLTKYAYSSFAHNGLIVDGSSLPRTDKFSDLTTLECHEVRPDGFNVTGRTSRLKDTVHSRTVDIREEGGVPLITVDDLISSTDDHTYDLLWNLGPEVEAVLHGQGFELFHGGKKMLDLHFEADVPTTVSLHKGETKPKYLGWRFPKFGQSIPAPVVRIRFKGNAASLRTSIRFNDFFYKNRGLQEPSEGWQRSNTERGLNYLFSPAKTDVGRSKLVVVFTAIHAPGDFTFNYKQSLDPVDVNALYILDDHGDQGAYYLADHGDKAIFRSVQELIGAEIDRLGLTKQDVITAGSSKGGSAAILHGAAFGAGHVIVGAPQVKIGSFLQQPHPNVLQFMTGSTTDEAVEELNREIFRSVESMSLDTKLAIVVGEEDHHYRHHVKPLQEHAHGHAKEIQVTVLPGLPHSEIGGVYKSFLVDHVTSIISGSAPMSGYTDYADIRVVGNAIRMTVNSRPNHDVSSRLFRESEVVEQLPYTAATSVSFGPVIAGKYRARVYYRHRDTREVTAFTTKWVTVP